MTEEHELKPRLLILSFSRIVSDARVLKQIAVFAESYRITTCGYGAAPEGVANHVELSEDLQIWRYPRGLVMLRQYERAYWSNEAIAAAKAALRGHSFDVILANDVEAVGLALSLRPRAGVHADLHEYAPRMREDLLRVRLFVRPFFDWMCRKFVARAQSWTTVSGGIAREYQRRFGFDPMLVTNATPFVEVSPAPVHTPTKLVHSGVCQRNRALLETVAAVNASRANVTLDLYLTPNDPPYLAEIRSVAECSGGRVTVHDPVPYELLNVTLQQYDVGIAVIPPVNFNYRWGLPNKLFDFVQARLGVIVGPSPEMAAYVERFGIGLVAPDFSTEGIARTLDSFRAEDVTRWKAASNEHAWELSSEQQVKVWKSAVDALVASAKL